MVWLEVTGNNGSALYLVVERLERRSTGGETRTEVAGLVGDGQYEGPVLMEVTAGVEVTFLDAWLKPGELQDFLRCVETERLQAALAEAALALAGTLSGANCAGWPERGAHNGRSAAGRVAESSPLWRQVA